MLKTRVTNAGGEFTGCTDKAVAATNTVATDDDAATAGFMKDSSAFRRQAYRSHEPRVNSAVHELILRKPTHTCTRPRSECLSAPWASVRLPIAFLLIISRVMQAGFTTTHKKQKAARYTCSHSVSLGGCGVHFHRVYFTFFAQVLFGTELALTHI